MRMWGALLQFALLLLLLLQPIFALEEYEMPCRLPSDYPSFWQYAQWRYDNRNVIPLSVGDIYSDKLQATQSSLGMLGWDLEDEKTLLSFVPDEIGGSKTAANAKKAEISKALQSARNAKKTYSDELIVYNKVSDEVRSLGILATYRWLFGWYFNGDKLIPAVPWKLVVEYTVKYTDPLRPEFGLIKFTDYAKYWQQSARAQLDALSAIVEAGNSAFAEAENEASQLHYMGVMQDGFPTNAQDAYLNWTHFTSTMRPICLRQGGAKAENSSLAWQYSVALSISREMQEETLQPHQDPAFFAEYNGAPLRASDMAAILAGYRNSTLLKGAWEMQKSLANSRQAALGAFESQKAMANGNLSLAAEAIAKIKRNGPEKFIGYGSLMPSASAFAPSASAGSPIEQLAFAEKSHASANGGYSKADAIYRAAAEQGYLAQAMPLMRASSGNAAKSLNSSLQLLSYMEWLSSEATSGASKSLSSLREKIQKADSSTSGGLSSYKQANAALALSDADYAKALEAQSLGEKFRLSMSAATRAQEASGFLGKNDNSKVEWEYSHELALASRLVGNLNAACPEYGGGQLERNVQWAREQFDAIPEAATVDKLVLLRGYSSAAKEALGACFAPLRMRHAALSAQIKALSWANHSISESFSRSFGPYVSEGGEWTDAAFASIGAVNSLLSTWEQKADGMQEGALQDMICENSRLSSVGLPLLRTGAFVSISKRLETHSDYPLQTEAPFGVRCKLGEDLFGFALTDGPPYVRYADLDNGSAAIYFASLPANASFSLVLVRNGTLFRVEKSGANVTLGPDGAFAYSEAGFIHSGANADSLEVYVPLPQGVASPIISFGGKRLAGAMVEENGTPYALFHIFGVRQGNSKYALSASGRAVILESDFTFPSSNQSAGLSHLLTISNLPLSDILDATLSDIAAQDSDSIKISSDTAKVELIGAKRAGNPSYRIRVSPSPESFSATVYYRTDDFANSIRNKYGLLSAEALNAGYEDNGGYLLQAKALIGSGDFAKAMPLLSKVEAGISELRSLREANAQYSDSIGLANAFLSGMPGAGAQDGGAYAKEMFKISNSLSSAITEAQSINMSGSQKSALSKVRAALFDAMSASREKSFAEYSRLEANFSALAASMAISGLDYPDGFNEAKSALDGLKGALEFGNSSEAIRAASLASSKIGMLQDQAFMLAAKSYDAELASFQEIKSTSQALSDRVESYSSSLTSLRSSSSLFSPILESKTARELSSSAQSAVASAEKASASSRTLSSLADFKKKNAAASASIQAASSRLDEAYSHLSSTAGAKCRIAQSAIAAMGEGGATAKLQEELDSANSQISQGNFAEAILRCEGMIARISGKSAQQQDFPVEIAALTILLAAGLAYVFFFRKPPEKPIFEKKKLENFSDAL